MVGWNFALVGWNFALAKWNFALARWNFAFVKWKTNNPDILGTGNMTWVVCFRCTN